MGAAKGIYEESWTMEHLLAHCEGYCVESPEGEHGYVEEVVWEPDGSKPVALRVRIVGSEPIDVFLDDVLELRPQGERIVVQALVDTEPIRELTLAGR